MSDHKDDVRMLDRRKFLKGSAMFAGAVGAGLAGLKAAAAQEQTQPAPADKDKPADAPKKDGEGKPGESRKGVLVDKQGREYRVCDMCGGNMYKQDNTWTCEQCGYSYTE